MVTFDTGIDYFDSLQAWDGKREYKLDTPRKILAELGNPQDAIKTIHVAGTNGKGSVSAYLAGLLQVSGKSPVGFLSSPHLSKINERLLINGVPVAFKRLNKAAEKVRKVSEALKLNPSFFEGVVASSFLIAKEENFEYLVVETGLGGRLDATNLISSPELSVITNIDYDHTHILGETLQEIAREKAGIIKEGRPVCLGKMPKEAEDEIKKIAKERNSEIISYASFLKNPLPDFLKKGAYSEGAINNRILAALVSKQLKLSEYLNETFEKVVWPGRFEILQSQEKEIILDVAHNPGGVSSLIESLENYLKEKTNKPPCFLLSMLERKNWQKMLQLLFEAFPSSRFMFTASSHHEALNPEKLKTYLEQISSNQVNAQVACSAEKALVSLQEYSGPIVISGSIFLIGEIRPHLVSKKFTIIKNLASFRA